MVKTIAVLVFLSITVSFVSCCGSSQASQLKNEKNANQQSSKNDDTLTDSQESKGGDEFDSTSEANRCWDSENRMVAVDCLQRVFIKADRKMNALYKEYISKFRPDRYSKSERAIANLENAQSAWQTYRDNNCKAVQNLFEGGTQQAEEYVMCRLDVTVVRISELKRIYARR
jgi:uncharacterized protein YecT (DUF1311 family)